MLSWQSVGGPESYLLEVKYIRVGGVVGYRKKAIEEHDLAVVACSFGKDSMIVLDMVRKECEKQNKPYRVIWNDTGVEYPEQYKFNKEVISKWNLEDKLIVAKSEDWTFWQIVKEYGMPIAPRDSRNKEMQRATLSCCNYLKKAPTKKALKEFKGVNYVYFTGLTAKESMNRKASAKRYGNYFYAKTWKHQKCHPILWWTDEDIEKYIQENEVPMAEIYNYNGIEGYKVRNGCWCCPQAWKYGKGKWLKRYYPKMYEYLIKNTEFGDYIVNKKLGLIDGQIGMISKEELLETRPCFFEEL